MWHYIHIILKSMMIYGRFKSSLWLIFFTYISLLSSIRKVIVPAVYKEWNNNIPNWVKNESLKSYYGYETFVYQKSHPKSPNYINSNQGTEAGVYLRYIVDHYHNFPDVAIFVHAKPYEHNYLWLEWIKCISPNASFININNMSYIGNRSIRKWGSKNLHVENCYRDVLKIVWDLSNNITEFNRRVPITKPITISVTCCQQFIMSRSKVLERPLSIWKKLLKIINEQKVCHEGEPDYKNLFFYYQFGEEKIGPEKSENGGRHVQGNAMEHLSEIVYGGYHDLIRPQYTMEDYCNNFLVDCRYSPCKSNTKDNCPHSPCNIHTSNIF